MNSVDRAILEGDDGLATCRRYDFRNHFAMVVGVGLGTVAKTIHPYPTQAEAIIKAGDAYNRSRLTPLAQKIFNALLRWRR